MADINLNPSLFTEFQLSVLDKRFEKKELRDLIHDQLTLIVDKKDILGIQLHPDAYPTKAIIQCNDKKTVEELIFKGIDIEDTHIDLSEPGYGALKVFVHNAPLDFPNASIKEWLERFGELSNFRDELYTNSAGEKTFWKTGTRSGLVRLHDLEITVPPRDILIYGTRKAEISVYHFGQTERYCRFCKRNVLKSHECDKVIKRTCHKCNQEGHLKANCPRNRWCTKCKTHGHIARNCLTADNFALSADQQVSNEERVNKQSTGTTTVVSGMKRQIGELKSPDAGQQGNPNTPGTKVSIQATVHDLVDADGFQVDSTTKKKMLRARRRDPNLASTPKDSASEIHVISSEKISPHNKKVKRSSGSMNIRNMFSNMFKGGARKSEESYEDAPEKEKEAPLTRSKKKEIVPKKVKNGESKVSEIETVNIDSVPESAENDENDAHTEEDSVSTISVVSTEDIDENTDGNQADPKGKTPGGPEERDGNNSSGEDIDSWSVKPPPGFISREYDTTLKLIEKKTFQSKVHVIAGSNFTGLKLCGDAELELNQVSLNEPGLTIARAPLKLCDMFEEEREEVSLMAVNTGVVDFKDDGGNDVADIHQQYMKMLGTLKQHCPKADIVVSSIIPRGGEKFKQVNEEIEKFNTLLEDSCNEIPAYHFCDNKRFILDEQGKIRSGLYENSLHLNSVGKRELGKSIVSVLKHAYFKNQVVALPEKLAESVKYNN